MAHPRRVLILGSTGSVGRNTLRVIEHLNALSSDRARFVVAGMAAGANAGVLFAQAMRFEVRHIAIASLNGQCPQPPDGVRLFSGPDAAIELVRETDADLVVSAIVGSAGLSATVEAVTLGRDIALANKETLVAAGHLVTGLVKKHGVRLLPIDSEHAAIHQCLAGAGGDIIRRVTLTASGGPFRSWSKEQLKGATVQQALAHPTWSMGTKITIDSATLMNKTLELIEAHHLFGLPSDRLGVLIHPQSIVHGMVEYSDGSVIAQMGPPDMAGPIQYALTWPDRWTGCAPRLDLAALSRLEFSEPDPCRFPSLLLAAPVISASATTAGAILNAANEEAVTAFLKQRVPFHRIAELASEALESIASVPADTLESVGHADATARRFVRTRLA